jgi:hypothetical protein
MNVKYYIPGLFISCCLLSLCGCNKKQRDEHTHFTKADSVTETYLELKDAMLQAWNMMINDDNQKIKAMHHLLHELMVSNPSQRPLLKSYEERLERLVYSRYTQKTMANADVIVEYDFASNSLVSELISLAESQTQFAYNTTLQRLVENIRTADQRTESYREEYDVIASKYNEFIDQNKDMLRQSEIDQDTLLQKKPLFQVVSEE